MKKVVFIALTVLTVVIGLPLLSIAGGGQEMEGRPDFDGPFAPQGQTEDRLEGSHGYLSDEEEPPGQHLGGNNYKS